MADVFDPQTIELTLKPIPPESVESLRDELSDYIRAGLQEKENVDVLEKGELVITPEETIPVDQVVVVVVNVLSSAALMTFEQVVLPWLKRKYEARQRRRQKDDSKKVNN